MTVKNVTDTLKTCIYIPQRDVFADLLTDQACAECGQFIYEGLPSTGLCVHTDCPLQGPVLTWPARTLQEFLLRCGIYGVHLVTEDSVDLNARPAAQCPASPTLPGLAKDRCDGEPGRSDKAVGKSVSDTRMLADCASNILPGARLQTHGKDASSVRSARSEGAEHDLQPSTSDRETVSTPDDIPSKARSMDASHLKGCNKGKETYNSVHSIAVYTKQSSNIVQTSDMSKSSESECLSSTTQQQESSSQTPSHGYPHEQTLHTKDSLVSRRNSFLNLSHSDLFALKSPTLTLETNCENNGIAISGQPVPLTISTGNVCSQSYGLSNLEKSPSLTLSENFEKIRPSCDLHISKNKNGLEEPSPASETRLDSPGSELCYVPNMRISLSTVNEENKRCVPQSSKLSVLGTTTCGENKKTQNMRDQGVQVSLSDGIVTSQGCMDQDTKRTSKNLIASRLTAKIIDGSDTILMVSLADRSDHNVANDNRRGDPDGDVRYVVFDARKRRRHDRKVEWRRRRRKKLKQNLRSLSCSSTRQSFPKGRRSSGRSGACGPVEGCLLLPKLDQHAFALRKAFGFSQVLGSGDTRIRDSYCQGTSRSAYFCHEEPKLSLSFPAKQLHEKCRARKKRKRPKKSESKYIVVQESKISRTEKHFTDSSLKKSKPGPSSACASVECTSSAKRNSSEGLNNSVSTRSDASLYTIVDNLQDGIQRKNVSLTNDGSEICCSADLHDKRRQTDSNLHFKRKNSNSDALPVADQSRYVLTYKRDVVDSTNAEMARKLSTGSSGMPCYKSLKLQGSRKDEAIHPEKEESRYCILSNRCLFDANEPQMPITCSSRAKHINLDLKAAEPDGETSRYFILTRESHLESSSVQKHSNDSEVSMSELCVDPSQNSGASEPRLCITNPLSSAGQTDKISAYRYSSEIMTHSVEDSSQITSGVNQSLHQQGSPFALTQVFWRSPTMSSEVLPKSDSNKTKDLGVKSDSEMEISHPGTESGIKNEDIIMQGFKDMDRFVVANRSHGPTLEANVEPLTVNEERYVHKIERMQLDQASEVSSCEQVQKAWLAQDFTSALNMADTSVKPSSNSGLREQRTINDKNDSTLCETYASLNRLQNDGVNLSIKGKESTQLSTATRVSDNSLQRHYSPNLLGGPRTRSRHLRETNTIGGKGEDIQIRGPKFVKQNRKRLKKSCQKSGKILNCRLSVRRGEDFTTKTRRKQKKKQVKSNTLAWRLRQAKRSSAAARIRMKQRGDRRAGSSVRGEARLDTEPGPSKVEETQAIDADMHPPQPEAWVTDNPTLGGLASDKDGREKCCSELTNKQQSDLSAHNKIGHGFPRVVFRQLSEDSIPKVDGVNSEPNCQLHIINRCDTDGTKSNLKSKRGELSMYNELESKTESNITKPIIAKNSESSTELRTQRNIRSNESAESKLANLLPAKVSEAVVESYPESYSSDDRKEKKVESPSKEACSVHTIECNQDSVTDTDAGRQAAPHLVCSLMLRLDGPSTSRTSLWSHPSTTSATTMTTKASTSAANSADAPTLTAATKRLGKHKLRTPRIQHLSSMKSIVFADLENFMFYKHFRGKLPPLTFVWGFISARPQGPFHQEKFFRRYELYRKLKSERRTHVSIDIGFSKDAVDFAMTLAIAKLDDRLPASVTFYIVSNDGGFREVENQMRRAKREVKVVAPRRHGLTSAGFR
ncbi:Zinc finger protein 451-like protein [Plakobranchus ocellatus]|uniref:Zinc finger protein 451-like protein n=1 Tax=Plakobranchus ocellatus TaxID=259542 RepID=A0AAV4CJB1_9GAST|nr:Zinc finger protein 451-like protein [Plakobranchus ocellatus]